MDVDQSLLLLLFYLVVFGSPTCLVLDLRLKSVNGRGFGPPLEVGVAGSPLTWLC